MRTDSHTFSNSAGTQLAARLDLPELGEPHAYALFAHCFTCGKDLRAVRNIAEALTARGIAVFRFDFPGLGESGGEFADSTFSSNVDDLFRASEYLAEVAAAPQIIVGHSLGGAAAIRVAPLIESARAVVTIGAPADPAHVAHLFAEGLDEIRAKGEAPVRIAKRDFRIKKAFLDDLAATSMEEATERLGKALLVLHSPTDEIVGIDNAGKIYGRARHPKSFISLDGADHLLTREPDSRYTGEIIASWAARYLSPADAAPTSDEVVVKIGSRGFRTDIFANGQRLVADEPIDVGGTNLGPTPYDLLAASLGACTAMTLRMYADHKKLPLQSVEVRLQHEKVHAADCEACESSEGRVDLIQRTISIEGDLDETQRARLVEIADRCPVHRSLENEVRVVTSLVE